MQQQCMPKINPSTTEMTIITSVKRLQSHNSQEPQQAPSTSRKIYNGAHMHWIYNFPKQFMDYQISCLKTDEIQLTHTNVNARFFR